MIDWSRVIDLKDEVGAEDFEEVVDLFLEEVADSIEQLKTGTHEESLEASLHALKGSALNLGFREFSAKCQVGETLAAQGKDDQVDIRDILACYDASHSEFVGQWRGKIAA